MILQIKNENGEWISVPAITGVGVASIEQTRTSNEDNGSNIIIATLTDGTTSAFVIKNGSKGSKGDAPKRNVDYWTEEDIALIHEYVDDQHKLIKADVDGLKKQINEEAHFRGYLSTNAKIQALKATPNDFVYSAESGTKWIYDAEIGWQDTKTPVPDQLTPASNETPLVNGEASSGESEEYARGDHRHPTDTTRLSVEEFNSFKADLETGLDNIIAKQNELIGGDSE